MTTRKRLFDIEEDLKLVMDYIVSHGRSIPGIELAERFSACLNELKIANRRISVLQCGLADACGLIDLWTDIKDPVAHDLVTRLRRQITWRPDDDSQPNDQRSKIPK